LARSHARGPDGARPGAGVGPRPLSGLRSSSEPNMRTYIRVRGNRGDEVSGEVVREQPLTIFVNGEKFLTLLCSPIDLEPLVVGYLWMEQVIGGPAEIRQPEAAPVHVRGDV